jgi:hypothetical protein
MVLSARERSTPFNFLIQNRRIASHKMYRKNKIRTIYRVSIVIACVSCAIILFGCGKNPATTGSSQPGSAAPTVASTAAMKQQQTITQNMNQYWLSHAPAAQKSQIQAAINRQQGSQNP